MRAWVLYDAACPTCLRLLARVQPSLEANGFRPEPLQSAWVRERLNLPEEQLLVEMRVLTRKGEVLGGADALVYLAGKFARGTRPWWAWALLIVSRMPLGMAVLRHGYKWFAARRYCQQGACSIAPQRD